MNELVDLFCSRYPKLYHMTSENSADSIMKIGLLSASALCDLAEIDDGMREKILNNIRSKKFFIESSNGRKFCIRDQSPLSASRLQRALEDCSIVEWLNILNSHVFFWPTEERLRRLVNAELYRNENNDILVVDSRKLFSDFHGTIKLSRINSGSTKPIPFPRGKRTFMPLGEYPLVERLSKYRSNAVAEVLIPTKIKDISRYVLELKKSSDFR